MSVALLEVCLGSGLIEWLVAAGAHPDRSLGQRARGGFLPGRQSRRQRVERQTREDLEHRDRSRGAQLRGSALAKLLFGRSPQALV